MVMCVAQKIGPIKASLIHWNGTTGEDLRRARGARPSIGSHDPWRPELCDLKAKVAWVNSERRARGARPSIGSHDPWRPELCDLKRVFPRSPGGSSIHRL